MLPPLRRAIPIGDKKAALAHVDALIAQAERTCARERALAARRKGAERSSFVPDNRLLVAEAHLARLRAQRAAILAGLEG